MILNTIFVYYFMYTGTNKFRGWVSPDHLDTCLSVKLLKLTQLFLELPNLTQSTL